MADTKISDLTAVASVAGSNEIAVNEAGTSKKASLTQVAAFTSPAASDTVAGLIEIAIQSEQETATDTVRAVTPGRQHFHPSAAKFWVYWTGASTTILLDYNVDSIANTGTGDADGTITTDFSGASWAGFVCTNDAGTDGWDADSIQSCGFNARAAGTFGVLCGFIIDGGTAAAALTNPDQWQVVGFGDHA
jgi:hypothetical protein